MFGQKRSKEIAALAAEQAVPKILVLYHHSNHADSRLETLKEFLAHTTTPKGWPALMSVDTLNSVIPQP